ncbi:hypothetical protein EFK50_03490 [Nocardioides marmoriginsengisoli]|uniref:Uncharacterized protein n=1 Tax=Nocardioides marmoriginsengisoli TaxID=661483 RepID=A0A3N0CNW9_9ACTN|nr:hypothetical protein [Nocardioides marmoriginsengisoli]RNL65050.1 hypothetical protein EFK50_03490 [Nocardioides marmoriginsengisoli]
MPMDEEEFVSYEQWGLDFFAEAVSQERILGAVNNIAGQPIDFGPIGVGPGKIAKVRAFGEIGEASAVRLTGPQISYRVELPVTLTFEVNLQVETHTFHAELLVPLTLTARALDGVRIFISIDPPRSSDVQVKVQAEGIRATIMQRVVNIEGELRTFVAKYVARETTKPHIEAARLIDVSAAIDKAWGSIAPGPAKTTVTDDFNEALEAEIRENEDTFLEM